jgi:hypothetical protein
VGIASFAFVEALLPNISFRVRASSTRWLRFAHRSPQLISAPNRAPLASPCAVMVFFFTSASGLQFYMGRDKYENEDLIK